MKARFLLYADAYESIRSLDPASKGQLLDAIFLYQRSEEIPPLAPVVEMAFSFIRRSFERDNAKYTERCDKARESAHMRWHKNNANACERIFSDANDADTVPVPVPVPDFKRTEESLKDPSGQKPTKQEKQPKEDRPAACPLESWQLYLQWSKGFHRDKQKDLGKMAPYTDPKVLDGARALDNLIRVRGFTENEVLAVLGWSMKDAFWSPNLRSLAALVKKSANGDIKFLNVMACMNRDLERRAERAMAGDA